MLDRYDSVEFDGVEMMASSGGLSCPDSDARISYYQISGFPTLKFNGGNTIFGYYTQAGIQLKEDQRVVDVVRDIAGKLKGDDNITWFSVSAENFESIHNHSAFAHITWDRAAGSPAS